MKLLLVILFCCIVACGDTEKNEITDWTEQSIKWEYQPGGSRLVTFKTEYFYGDKIRFDSVNGKGVGYIDGIGLAQDGSVYYSVEDAVKKYEDDGQNIIHGGIYPDEITLLERGVKSSGQISLNENVEGFFMKGAQINDVLQFISKEAGLQYIHNPELDGPDYSVTGHIHEILNPVEQIETLALAYNLEVVVINDTVHVFTPSQFSAMKKKIKKMAEQDGGGKRDK